jgi:hypothetical protein
MNSDTVVLWDLRQDAGMAADHHSPCHDAGRSPRGHAYPPCVADLIGDRAAAVMARPRRAPHQTILLECWIDRRRAPPHA